MTFLEYLNGLEILDRRQVRRRLQPNIAQMMLYAELFQATDYTEAYRTRSAVPKGIILKARQLGVSTEIQAFGYYAAEQHGYSFLTLAHTDQDSLDLYHRYSRWWYVENQTKGGKRIQRKRSEGDIRRDSQIALDLPSNGRIIVRTAGGRGVGRSQTFQFGHLSEAAFYSNAEETFESVMGAATHAGIVIESTANGTVGEGKWFYDFWQASANGYTGYVPIFLPWWLEEDYQLDHTESNFGPRETSDLDAEEKYLYQEHRVNLNQLAWRRSWIAGPLASGDANKFRRQFPSTPDEAFTMTGEPSFDRDACLELVEQCRQTQGKGEGFAWIWEEPKEDMTYVMGVDVSEGIGRNYSTIEVLTRTDPPRQVYEWANNQVDPVTFATNVWLTAKRYNNAEVVLEINNHGLTTMTRLQDMGGLYLWMRRDWDHIGKEFALKPGWKTTGATKPILLDYIRSRIAQRTTGIKSLPLAHELLAYSPTAEQMEIGGSHFDRMIAYGLCAIGLQSRPVLPHQEVEVPKEPTIIERVHKQIERERMERIHDEWD